jgi:hypothetical protein
MVLMVKGKIAPLAITMLLPEAVKHFQVFQDYLSHFRSTPGAKIFSPKGAGAYRFDAPRRKILRSQPHKL